MIGTASVTVTDENGTTTTPGTGLTGLLEQAEDLEGAYLASSTVAMAMT